MPDNVMDALRGPDVGDPSPTDMPDQTSASEGNNATLQSNGEDLLLPTEYMPSTTTDTGPDPAGTPPHVPEFDVDVLNPETSPEVREHPSISSQADMKYAPSSSSVRALDAIDSNNLAEHDDASPLKIVSREGTPDTGQETSGESDHGQEVQDLAEGTPPQSSDSSSHKSASVAEEVSSPVAATEYLPEEVEDDSASRLEWIRQKQEEGATSEVLDEVMCLVGREKVKEGFLSAKAVVEARRLRGEKLGIDVLMYNVTGNEGSGVSTMNGLWGRFEKSVVPETHLDLEWKGPDFDYQLPDYSDEELHILLNRMIKKRNLKAEGEIGGFYTGIVARRMGRKRGSSSFKNFWTVRDTFNEICRRQADRLQNERRFRVRNSEQAECSDEYFLTREDMLGKPPMDRRNQSKAYSKLQAMTGLVKIKKAVDELAGLAEVNYSLETQNKQQIQPHLNRVFVGPPGTGKTTVAKLFGEILGDLGLISTNKVAVKGPSDFTSTTAGGDFENTREILEETEGAVLIIDDSSALCPMQAVGRTTSNVDTALHQILDTIVSKTSAEPGQDRSIIFVGYKDEMQDMFEKCNAGLRSRFPLEDAFEFPDYDLPELMQILDSKLAKDGIEATTQAKEVALQVLARMRDRPKFGNGRDVNILVNRARLSYKQRMEAEDESALGGTNSWLYKPVLLEPQDFDPKWNRGNTDAESCEDLFRDFVGFDSIVQQFRGYQQIATGLRLHGKDPRPHIPFTFIFKGPPGTGKTSTARKLGQIFYDMGFLASDQVVECSVTDLIGEYVGHTGPRVQAMLEKALGKVLFIDEAYRLAGGSRGISGSSFEEEAVGELVDSLTKPKYSRKIIIILAGYSEDMDILMKSNRGLRGRFATEVVFPQLSPRQCISFLGQLIGKMNITIRDKVAPTAEEKDKVNRLFKKLTATRDWSNGRDIESLAEFIVGEVFRKEGIRQKASSRLQVSTVELISFLQQMLRSRLAGELHDRGSE